MSTDEERNSLEAALNQGNNESEYIKHSPANGGEITALSHGVLGVGVVRGEMFDSQKERTFDRGEFERISNEAIKFLNDHYHPHTKMIITTTGAEIVEGTQAHVNNKYVKG